MEIERKFLIKELPANLAEYPCHLIEQAYLCTDPVIRIRRQDDDYYLTYKGKGLMSREEYNLPLNKDAYEHLLPKADGNVISKKRYVIPLENPKFADDFLPATDTEAQAGSSSAADTAVQTDSSSAADMTVQATPFSGLKIELDLFEPPFQSLILAEVEFPTEEMANAFLMPDWFLEDVTCDPAYHNSNLSKRTKSD